MEIKKIEQAINTIITIDNLLVFVELIDNISDKTIINYIKEVAKYLIDYYKNTKIICLEGKGHCEDALINPKIKITELDKILL